MNALQELMIKGQRTVRGGRFPRVLDGAGTGAVSEYVAANNTVLAESLKQDGAILFRDFQMSGASSFESALNASDYAEMPYVGGAAPRSVVGGRVVTANESPPSEKIPFHHEMAQVPQPPGYIFFYCEVAPDNGGATSLLDSAEVCDVFYSLDAGFAEEIAASGVRYRRVMPAETDPDSAIGRSWRETFKAKDRATAEQAMSNAGMTWSWRDNDDVETMTSILPAIRTDADTGRRTFFNSMVAAYTGWNDSRNSGREAVVTASGEPLPASLLDELVAAMDAMAVNIPWQAGDMLWLNNYTVLHARQPFSGDRRVLASIAYR